MDKPHKLCRPSNDWEEVINSIIDVMEGGIHCNPVTVDMIDDILRKVMRHYRGTENPKTMQDHIIYVITKRLES